MHFASIQITSVTAAGTAYCDSYTNLELEKAIQQWLKRAKERCDTRKKIGTCETDQ